MHILLPPSETKRPGGGSVFVPGSLANETLLGEARTRVRDALVELSGDENTAARVLKLGVKNRSEVQHNLALSTSGTLPAIERYTGVLYDALDVASLATPARRWLENHVSVQSALFGLIGADDHVPAYRLSASTVLPGLGEPLKRTWAKAHKEVDWASLGWVLDLRSKDYAALAPLPADAGYWLHVAQRDDRGQVRALNHFNKAAKGDLVRRLAESHANLSNPEEFVDWAEANGVEIVRGSKPDELTLVTALGAPVAS